MEYCAGGDLSAFIKSRRTIPEKYVRRFVQQIGMVLKLRRLFLTNSLNFSKIIQKSLCYEASTFERHSSYGLEATEYSIDLRK